MEQKEEINIHPEKNEEIRIQNNEERLRNLWDNFKRSNIQIIGVPEGEEEEQKIENLFEKNHEGKLPQFGKGNKSSRKSRKFRQSQSCWTQGGTHQGTS